MISEIDIRDWESKVEHVKYSLIQERSTPEVWELVNVVEEFLKQYKQQTAALLRKKEG